jgi:hypothetical protein
VVGVIDEARARLGCVGGDRAMLGVLFPATAFGEREAASFVQWLAWVAQGRVAVHPGDLERARALLVRASNAVR